MRMVRKGGKLMPINRVENTRFDDFELESMSSCRDGANHPDRS
jgi:hypothetical protein